LESPHCVLELRELHGMIHNQNNVKATILAISPEKPEFALSLADQHQLPFPLLSDVTGQVMRDYQLAWEIPNTIRKQYLSLFGRDLNVINAGSGWVLPVPATYILNQDGVIIQRYVDEDYTSRMEPSDIIKVLRDL
jgi:peroxiredoxin